jgi:hypothetical protein
LADGEVLRDHDMQSRSLPSLALMYFGALATALSVIALGLTAVVKASAGLSDGIAREKTLLELQVENSREIRRALATPVRQPPPLPPITARPARDLRESTAALTRKPVQTKPSQDAMNAMAMEPSGRYPSVQSSSHDYSVRDRHTSY